MKNRWDCTKIEEKKNYRAQCEISAKDFSIMNMNFEKRKKKQSSTNTLKVHSEGCNRQSQNSRHRLFVLRFNAHLHIFAIISGSSDDEARQNHQPVRFFTLQTQLVHLYRSIAKTIFVFYRLLKIPDFLFVHFLIWNCCIEWYDFQVSCERCTNALSKTMPIGVWCNGIISRK